MDLVFESEKRRIVKKEDITFSLTNSDLYLVEITARVKGEKQLQGTDDEDLRVEIDGRKFPKLDNPERYLDSPASFSGGKLHGLKETIFFILPLSSGNHVLSLIPDYGADLEIIKIFNLSDASTLELDLHDAAEDGDRRPWITFVLTDIGLKDFSVNLVLKRRFFDSDDVKVIVDGEVKRSHRSILRKLWYFIASVIEGEVQGETFIVNLPVGIHYLEFWADRMPILNSIKIVLESNVSNKIKKYKDDKFNRDYNQLDEYIAKATDFWNNFFSKQMYPPPIPLDSNLVKAMIYRESRLGYFPNTDIIDVMQAWDPQNPTQNAILGKTPANEFINPDRIGHISYSYPDDKTPPRVDSREESIFWGVRWLYHKAQYLLEDDNGTLKTPYVRKRRSWEEAVRAYNANAKIVEEYIKEVFSVYEKSIDLEGNTL